MEKSRQGFFILVVAFCAAAGYFLVRFFSENDESRVRRALHVAVAAVEREDLLKLASLVDDEYQDGYGNDKAAVLGIAGTFLREFNDVKIEIKQLAIEWRDGVAECEVAFRCLVKKPGDPRLYGDSGKIKAAFRKADGRWKVVTLEYKGANELLFLQSVA